MPAAFTVKSRLEQVQNCSSQRPNGAAGFFIRKNFTSRKLAGHTYSDSAPNRVYHDANTGTQTFFPEANARMSQPTAEVLPQSPQEKAEESRQIRRLQLMMSLVMQVIQQDRNLPVEQASEMVADARRAALTMFPDKELAFNLLYWPRLQRTMRERYRMQ